MHRVSHSFDKSAQPIHRATEGGGSMKRLFLLFSIFSLLLCTGCRSSMPQESVTSSQLVTQISIIRLSDLEVHSYTGQKSMIRFLNHLRCLDPFGISPGPSQSSRDDYRITLTFSDGRQRVYLQKADQYFLGMDGYWQLVHPKDAAKLSLLFAAIPSDHPRQKTAIPEI